MKVTIRTSLQLLLVLTLALSTVVVADVRLPRLVSDGVVLQRDTPFALWGWADAGEAVEVLLDGKSLGSVKAGQAEWSLPMGAQPAGGPHTIEVIGNNRVAVKDVYFGDVWVAAGQSNMELPMERVKEKYGEAIATANYPLIRHFRVPKEADFKQPRADFTGGSWQAADPQAVLNFSAAAFFFARQIHEKYQVPIGIINNSYGGSAAESWMSEEALKAFPHYLETAVKYRYDDYLNKLKQADQKKNDAWYANINENDRGLTEKPQWFAAEYDASSWKTISLPAYWEDEGVEAKNGVVWFRKEITLPASAAGKPARLMLGRIVDADTAYVNGVEVGSITYQYPPRRYTVPENVLQAGKNSIVVRVTSNAGKGGFVKDKPYWLEVDGHKTDLTGEWRYRVGVRSEPLQGDRFVSHMQPLGFYNAMLAPILKTKIKGVIWYQGESNTGRPSEYVELFPAMIRDWRKQFDQGNFPFIYAQLPNFEEAREQPVESNWAETRDAQLKALSEPNTAMAVLIDAGEWNDIHPLNKKAVGERLALAARKLAYGEKNIVYSGPLFKSMKIKGNKAILRFDHVGGGLVHKGDELRGFAVAGSDGKFVWAKARIKDNKAVVWSEEVSEPVKVRYAWADNPDKANLYNEEGLPASPFQAEK